jgi:hypothetical protein
MERKTKSLPKEVADIKPKTSVLEQYLHSATEMFIIEAKDASDLTQGYAMETMRSTTSSQPQAKTPPPTYQPLKEFYSLVRFGVRKLKRSYL